MLSTAPPGETEIQFDGFTIDLQRRSLSRGSERIHLTPMPFKTLEYLALNRGRILSKEQLLEAVWGEQREGNTVEQAIRQIRRALGDEKENPRFIQTIPGEGYSFIAEVAEPEIVTPEPEFIDRPELIAGVSLAGGRSLNLIRLLQWVVLPSAIGAGALLVFAGVLDGHARLSAANPTKITQSETVVLSPLLSDGARIYYPQYDNGGYEVASTSVAGGTRGEVATGIPNPELCDLTPDGSAMLLRNLIHSRNDDEPLYIESRGSAAQRVGNILAYDAAWFPQTKRILYSADGVAYSTDLSGKSSKRLFTVPGNAFWFRWSPDGTRLRFTVLDRKSEATSIWEVVAGNSAPHRLFPNFPYNVCCGSWTPDGKYFLFQARVGDMFQIWAQREQRDFFFTNRPFPLIFGATSYRGPLVGKNNRELFLRAENPKGELMRFDAKAQAFIPILPALSIRTLAFSRRGDWIAYTSLTDDNLWRCRADGTQCLQLTQGFKNTLMPRWSPDGRTIVFMGLRFSGEWGIYTVSANGGPIHSVIERNQAEGYPDWSPDGQHLVYSEVIPVAQPQGVHVVDLRTGQVSTLPGSAGFSLPRWSPDGRSIVAIHSGDDYPYLFDFTTAAWRQLMRVPGSYPNWSHDGKAVYFQSNQGGTRTVYRFDVAHRTAEKVASLKSVESSPFILGDWMGLAPDDSPIAVQDMSTDDIFAWNLIEQ